MLNAECGDEMDETISPARVAINNQLLNTQQRFLANQHDYLRGKVRVELPAVVGQQYYTPPTGIDLDRIEKPAFTNVNNFRYRIAYGIGQEDYNLFRSDLGVQASPVMRWDMVNVGGVLKVELWPIPSTAQTIMFSGLLPISDMASDAATCVIDDLALVLFTAAEILARRQQPDTQAKFAKAQAYIEKLRAGFPSRFDKFNLAGKEPSMRDLYVGNNRRPVVATN